MASSISTASKSKAKSESSNCRKIFYHIPQDGKQQHPLNSAALKVLADDNSDQELEYVDDLLKSSEKPHTV